LINEPYPSVFDSSYDFTIYGLYSPAIAEVYDIHVVSSKTFEELDCSYLANYTIDVNPSPFYTVHVFP